MVRSEYFCDAQIQKDDLWYMVHVWISSQDNGCQSCDCSIMMKMATNVVALELEL